MKYENGYAKTLSSTCTTPRFIRASHRRSRLQRRAQHGKHDTHWTAARYQRLTKNNELNATSSARVNATTLGMYVCMYVSRFT